VKIQIKHRWNGRTLYEGEYDSLATALIAGVRARADLKGAYLKGADLEGADLEGAYLKPIRDDIFKILESAPLEARTLREALAAGQVNGSCYEGECACLVGTIANARGCNYLDRVAMGGLVPNGGRPAERWFLAIQPGMSASHPVVEITLQWIDEWLAANTLATKP